MYINLSSFIYVLHGFQEVVEVGGQVLRNDAQTLVEETYVVLLGDRRVQSVQTAHRHQTNFIYFQNVLFRG